MTIYRFKHPNINRWYVWDAKNGELSFDGQVLSLSTAHLPGALLERFITYTQLTNEALPYGTEEEFHEPDFDVRKPKSRLLKLLDVAQPDRPNFIETMRNRCYRWLLQVEVVDDQRLSTLPYPPESSTGGIKVSTSALPVFSGPALIGRKSELKRLWDDYQSASTQLAVVQGLGGVGKSSLINRFVDEVCQNDKTRPSHVFGWSFYAQGTHQILTQSTTFFEHAIRFFGGKAVPSEDLERVQLLIELIQQTNCLLILDGLEPLQYPTEEQQGWLRDFAIRLFLIAMARDGAKSRNLVLISSRQPIVELNSSLSARHITLEQLPVEDGVKLLKRLKLTGSLDSFRDAVIAYQGHPLSLMLLGNLLRMQFQGDIGQWRLSSELLFEDTQNASQASRVLDYYLQTWKADDPKMILLSLLALFDRPVRFEEWAVLLERLEFAKPLATLSARFKSHAKTILAELGLITDKNFEVDIHPLIRAHFDQHFATAHPDDFVEAQEILASHFSQGPSQHVPGNLGEMELLYRAMYHLCRIRNYRSALKLYEDRIMNIRGEKVYYNFNKLGSFPFDVAAISAFYPEGWSVEPLAGLTEEDVENLLGYVSFSLYSLGRLRESSHTYKLCLEMSRKRKAVFGHHGIYRTLIDIYLCCGELQLALSTSSIAVREAFNDDAAIPEQVESRCSKGYVLMHLGRFEEAVGYFQKAERIQGREKFYSDSFLTDYCGFQYAEFLLSTWKSTDDLVHILDRCKNASQWVKDNKTNNPYLHLGLYGLIKGRILIELGRISEGVSALKIAEENVRKYNSIETTGYFLVSAIDIRATIPNESIKKENREKLYMALAEAENLINASDLTLYRVDALLARARLLLVGRDLEEAEKTLLQAENKISRLGYFLKRKPLAALKTQLLRLQKS